MIVETSKRRGGKAAYRCERRREIREDINFHVKSVAPNIYRIFGYSASIPAEYSVFGQWPNRLFVASLFRINLKDKMRECYIFAQLF